MSDGQWWLGISAAIYILSLIIEHLMTGFYLQAFATIENLGPMTSIIFGISDSHLLKHY